MQADELKAARMSLHLSQGELATRIGRSRDAVAKYESGRLPIPAAVASAMLALADPLDDIAPERAGPKPVKPKAVAKLPPAPPVENKGLMAAMLRNPPYATTAAEAKAMRDLRAEQRSTKAHPFPVGHVRMIRLRPTWRRLDCGRDVNAAIPDPLSVRPPEWAGPRGVMTASGVVYDYETAHAMSAPDVLHIVQATAGDW